MQKIEAPVICPSCKQGLTKEKDQLFCRNKDCESMIYKSIEHFAKTLKIKGLGPATISKLDIRNIVDIYELSYDAMVAALGIKIAEKVKEEVKKSRTASLNLVLPAFGIPLIGRTASEKICSTISHISELSEKICKIAGLGPKATENLMDWYNDVYIDGLDSLAFTFIPITRIKSVKSKGEVCISGKLTSFKTKALATEALELAGYTVKNSITKDVTILINESGIESSKTKKAQDLGLTIINKIQDII